MPVLRRNARTSPAFQRERGQDIAGQLHQVGRAGIVTQREHALPEPLQQRQSAVHGRCRAGYDDKQFPLKARSGFPSTGAATYP